ncbi:MAG: prolyl oligopeptidase family serine peptidase [Owenweeksia sp.]|nr:prolyl oligopeptidase family serine peptidase [Owenweeksia sp.]
MKKLSLFILALSLQFSWAQESAITPMDVANLHYVTSATISSNGEKIAYRVAVPADPKKENSSMDLKLHLYDVKSETSIPFVTQGTAGDVKFRPGYNSLTFTSRREGDNSTSLYEIQLDGGEAQKIYEYNTSIYDYDWHPDGEQLVFIAKEKSDDKGEELPYQPEIYEENLRASQVFKADLSQENPEAQNLGLNKHAGHAYWNHDGSRIAVSAAPTPLIDDHYTSQRIYIIGTDGKLIGEVEHKAKLGEFNWSPDGKQIAFIGGEDKHPSELFYLKDGGKQPERITTTNEWLENRKLGGQEIVTYKARDGREIQGILIRPVDAKNEQTYPLITVVHGGPESHYDNGWLTYYSSPGQLAAGKGYAVFYPNYRGSTGRGIEFIKSSQADPAGKEFDDVVDGIDHLN